jgi:glycosyltransferase involved in cell wall biosynthesis
MRHDVPELLRQLDIFVLSSTTEGISLTLLEAMATELPVVATNVGGNPEVVLDGETGYIVPSHNPEEMANKLLLLINDKKLRQQMGFKGRERVIENFSIIETARKYEALYREVLNKRW